MTEAVAELSMRLSRAQLAGYGAARSRHDFTLRQLLSRLVLRACLRTTCRGVLETLALSPAAMDSTGLSATTTRAGPVERLHADAGYDAE